MGPGKRNRESRYARLLKVLKADPDLTHAQLEQRGFSISMVRRARKELGIGPSQKTPYLTREDVQGKDVPGRHVPFNYEPGRKRQNRFKK